MGKFMANLRAQPRDQVRHGDGLPGLPALTGYVTEFVVFTAVRIKQVIEAKWDDFDWDHNIWICTDHKTAWKTGLDYVVPLSRQARAVLDKMRELQKAAGIESDFVFPGKRAQGCMARISVVRYVHNALKYPDITIHGFRSTFKQWCIDHDKSETTSEMALGHKIGDSTRNAYARGANKVEPLRILMHEWADYCDRTEALPGDVVPFKRRIGNGK